MFGIENLMLFIISGLLLNISPGPDTVLIVSRSASQGWRAGLMAVAGIGFINLGLVLSAQAEPARMSLVPVVLMLMAMLVLPLTVKIRDQEKPYRAELLATRLDEVVIRQVNANSGQLVDHEQRIQALEREGNPR